MIPPSPPRQKGAGPITTCDRRNFAIWKEWRNATTISTSGKWLSATGTKACLLHYSSTGPTQRDGNTYNPGLSGITVFLRLGWLAKPYYLKLCDAFLGGKGPAEMNEEVTVVPNLTTTFTRLTVELLTYPGPRFGCGKSRGCGRVPTEQYAHNFPPFRFQMAKILSAKIMSSVHRELFIETS